MKDSFYSAMHITTDFMASILVALLMGYGIDLIFKTKPWCMVVFLFLGIIAGVLQIYRFFKKINSL